MSEEWKKAKKKPVVICFREVKGESEIIETLNGIVKANATSDYIIRGVHDELYPCDKLIFHETHEVLEV